MKAPQEIEDEEHEQTLEQVCAIDVAKASGMVCTRVPHRSGPGKRRTRVWEADATTGAVLELGEYLAGEGAGAAGARLGTAQPSVQSGTGRCPGAVLRS